ncbi:MAG: MBL fold metallo-hydrolase [Candidatus Sungbacteria bacterium]|uniref:MBL fold metallo-hydrolase n=1 Tax=Candidatus Sungiibacteriota bacterium TaxID=2750080 RepID=A0A932YXP9_9BACT|nr:MBL fold metallo-hydrolase [Candidatus Sungbacteria bacterium]
MTKFSLSFWGGAREVTGACYLLEVGRTKILVDCGMFQGCDDCDIRTHEPLPFKAAELDAVFVTHAHIDHIGRLPKLWREGFRGPIYATTPTRDLADIMLADAMQFLHAGKELYSASDLAETLKLFQSVEYGEDIAVGGISARLLNSSHILGSAFVRLDAGGKVFVFTGDVGNVPSILLPPRASLPETSVLIVEATYGNKRHKHTEDRRLMLERAIEDVVAKKGTLMLPVFATERTQEILFEINEMLQFKRVPEVPIFVDSPLAIRATRVFAKYPGYYRPEVQELAKTHPHLFEFKNLKFTESVEESKAINNVPPPKVILAGSGMSAGGRILHHEKRYLPDAKSILFITGYQAAGSLGRRLLDKAREVKIHGESVRVAAETRVVDGYSAHADEDELFSFVAEMRDSLERVFVVQGEPAAVLGFQATIQDHLGIPAAAPLHGEKFEI